MKLASAPSSLVLSCLVSIVRALRVGGREGVKPTQSSQDWEPSAGPQDSKVCYSRGSFSQSPFLKGLEREEAPLLLANKTLRWSGLIPSFVGSSSALCLGHCGGGDSLA